MRALGKGLGVRVGEVKVIHETCCLLLNSLSSFTSPCIGVSKR